MKRLKQLFYCVLAAFMFTGCQSYKKVPYLQDAEVVLYSTQNEQLSYAKLLQKSEMRKDIVIELSYKGFS